MNERFKNGSCDPNHFYNDTDNPFLDAEAGTSPYIAYFTMAVSIIFSPILIGSPFLVPKLKSPFRKVVSSIVLASSIV